MRKRDGRQMLTGEMAMNTRPTLYFARGSAEHTEQELYAELRTSCEQGRPVMVRREEKIRLR